MNIHRYVDGALGPDYRDRGAETRGKTPEQNTNAKQTMNQNKNIDDLIEQVEDEQLRKELQYEREREYHDRHVEEAEENLREVQAFYDYDMTGQDGEREIDAAADDLIRARDERIKHRDPERWAEMRMGA